MSKILFENGVYFIKYDGWIIRSAFQGIFNADRGLYGVEALIRCFDVDSGESVSPSRVISAISNPYSPDMFYLINKVHIKNFIELTNGYCGIFLFLNITPSFFDSIGSSQEIKEMVTSLISETGMKTMFFVAEILETESSQYLNFGDGVSFIKSTGAEIALDDFGDDSSNVERYNDICPDVVKISRELYVKYFESNSGIDELKHLVSTFHADGVRVVVEGVEIPDHVSLLFMMGVDYLQGFALHKPAIYMKGDVIPISMILQSHAYSLYTEVSSI